MISLKELRQKCNAATPGPWKSIEGNEDIGFTMQIMSKFWDVEGPRAVAFYTSNTEGKGDSEFIAACNPATVLALLDALECAIKGLQISCVCYESDNTTKCDACYSIEELHEVISE